MTPAKLLIVPSYAIARAMPDVFVDRARGFPQLRTRDGYLVMSIARVRAGAVRDWTFSSVVLHMDMPGLTPAELAELLPSLTSAPSARPRSAGQTHAQASPSRQEHR
jgi:hypothetical protein